MPSNNKKKTLKVMSKEPEKKPVVTTQPAATPYSKYDEAAEYNYYDAVLRKALEAKNPEKYKQLTRDIQTMRSVGNVGQWDVQRLIPKDYAEKLDDAEIKAVLSKLPPIGGQDPYTRFQALRKSPNLAGKDFGWAQRYDFSEYGPRDLAAEKVMSLATDSGQYYRPTVQNGVIVRNTNIPAALGVMRR